MFSLMDVFLAASKPNFVVSLIFFALLFLQCFQRPIMPFFFSPRVSEIDDHQENGYCPAAAPLHLKEVGDGAKRHRRGLFPPQFAIVRPRVSSRRTPRGQSSRSPTPARPAPPPTSAPPPPGTRGRAPPSTTRASSCGAPREARLTTGPPVPGGGDTGGCRAALQNETEVEHDGQLAFSLCCYAWSC